MCMQPSIILTYAIDECEAASNCGFICVDSLHWLHSDSSAERPNPEHFTMVLPVPLLHGIPLFGRHPMLQILMP